MTDFRKELNEAQWEAVSHEGGPLLVIAGAGSGKTRTIVYRMAHLVKSGTPADSILLLTFTRKAAQEMKDRAGILLGSDGLAGITGGTFHAFAFSMLRRFAEAENGPGRVSIMDQSDAENAIRDLRDELKLGKGDKSFPKKNTVLGLISKSRNKELSMEAVLQNEAFHLLKYNDELEQLSREYAGFKKRNGLFDYDDLLFGLEALLRDNESVRDYVRSRFRHVMVDEYQDTNLVQARIVKLLAGDGGNIMAVGDDAQSIYAFRGANVYNILSFQEMFPGAKLVRLEQNYRSTQPILDLTNAILEQAELKIRKNLFTERKEGKRPQVIRTISDRSQAQAVVSKALEYGRKYPLHEVAILFRAGYQSYSLEVALNKLGVKYKKYGGIRFNEAAHIKDVLSFIRLVRNPADLPAWQRALDHVKGVGRKTVVKIHHFIMNGDEAGLAKFCAKRQEVMQVIDMLDDMRKGQPRPAPVLAQVLEFYQPLLERKFPDDYPRRQSGLEQLTRIAAGYEELDNFLADISLETPDDEDAEDRENCLVLSTIHSAKGLEWSAVAIIDLVQDRFPSRHAMNRAEDLEEERRLMYVACTRARNELSLFMPSTIYNQFSHSSEPAADSPFVSDLPLRVYEAWRENYSGGLAPVNTSPTTGAPSTPTASSSASSSGNGDAPKRLGHCRHKIFGRGKIIATVGDDKYRINFPGFGLKVILSEYVTLEE